MLSSTAIAISTTIAYQIAKEMAQLEIKQQKYFSDLANSRKEFDSVGRLFCAIENPNQQYFVGMNDFRISGKSTFSHIGSGVYIGNNIVITAAHCIPEHIKNNIFIDDLTKHWFFHTANNNGIVLSRVIKAVRHPMHKPTNGIKLASSEHDIAVLLLDRDPANIQKAEMDTKPFVIMNDCTAVGYTDLIRPRPEDSIRIPIQTSNDPIKPKAAVKIPNCCYTHNLAFNAIGCEITQTNSKSPEIPFTYREHNLFETGTAPGMSGGGWFTNDGKLFAISSAGKQNANDNSDMPYSEHYNSVTKDDQRAVPLCHYESWLSETIHSLQKDLPELKSGIIKWYENRAQYELKQFPEFAKEKRALCEKEFNEEVKINPNFLPFFLRKTTDTQQTFKTPSVLRINIKPKKISPF